MANIRLDLDASIYDGQNLTFKAPCDSTNVTGLITYYPNGDSTKSTVFTFKDAHGNALDTLDLFAEGAYLTVVLDTVNKTCYFKNADTNAYLEGRFDIQATNFSKHTGNKSNPHGVTASQVGLGNVNNTSDANKPVSTLQATAIADAKKAGTDAQTNLNSHASNTTIHITAEERTKWNEGGTSTKVVEGITVSASKWVDETETTALWRYRIENANIKDDMTVGVYFAVTDYTEENPSSLVRATNAGVLAATTARLGSVDIYSTSQPDTNLTCTLELTGYKVV